MGELPSTTKPPQAELLPLGTEAEAVLNAVDTPDSESTTALRAHPVSPSQNEQRDANAYDFLWRVHANTNEYIRFADAKAGIVLGVVGGILTSEVAKAGPRMNELPMGQWTFAEWGAFSSMVLLLLSALAAGLAIAPRSNRDRKRGFIFWSGVREYPTSDQFASAVAAHTASQLQDAVADHVYTLAGIADTKFYLAGVATLLAFFGGLAGVLVIALY